MSKFGITGAEGKSLISAMKRNVIYAIAPVKVDERRTEGTFLSLGGCPPGGAPLHLNVSLVYDITAESCDDAGNVPVDASVTFTNIAAELAPWTDGTGPFGFDWTGLCVSAPLISSAPLVFTCPDPCVFNTVTATFRVLVYFDGDDYWLYTNVFHDSTDEGICGDGSSHDLPQSPASPFTNIGPTSPVGVHTLNFSSVSPAATAHFTITIS